MEFLTRVQIDQVLDQLTADDLIEATDAAGGKAGARVAGLAFHYGASRVLGELPDGVKYTARVKAADFGYLAKAIGEAVNVDSPLSEATSELLDSQEPGVEESDPAT